MHQATHFSSVSNGIRIVFCLLCLLLPTKSWADKTILPKHTPVPGGIAVLPLSQELAPANNEPNAWYRGNRVMLQKVDQENESYWVAVVGIPLSANPGTHNLAVYSEAKGKQLLTFEVEPKAYREQRITLSNKRQVTPLTTDLERINAEKSIMVAAFKHWNTEITPTLQMAKPTSGPYSSPFGLRRFFNDQPRNPHSGLDIAAPEGTPIQAPAEAVVSVTGDYFFNGKTVLLDHGHGLVSMYCHMSRIDVAEGDRIKPGDTIGLVGKTGRVTGPHLHWSVSLNNARIDPSLLMANKADTP